MHEPWNWTIDELRALIGQAESLRLDFKQSSLLQDSQEHIAKNLTKEVSAFANTEGGTIVIGISETREERACIAKEFDEGIDPQLWSPERLQQFIEANVSPYLTGLRIRPVCINDEQRRYAFVIYVPPGSTAYQASDHRYYGRFEYESKSLSDYEIRLRIARGKLFNQTQVEPSPGTLADKRFYATVLQQKLRRVLLGVVIIGVILRLWQYVGNSSLWLDEVGVALNVRDRSIMDLLIVPLDFDQVASRGFLLAEELAVLALGPSEYALRLFPVVCAIVALVAFWRTAERVLIGLAPLIAVVLFVVAVPLIFFAAQVKQYSTDVAVAGLLSLLALDLAQRSVSRRQALWAGGLGGVAVWFSHTAILMLVGLGVALFLLAWSEQAATNRRAIFALAPALLLWGVFALIATAVEFANITPTTSEYLQQFWREGFMPLPPLSALQKLWPWDPLRTLFGVGGAGSLSYPYATLYVGLAALGFWVLWGRQRSTALLLLAPIGVTLAAAIFQQYPFMDRAILFLIPIFLLVIAESTEWLRQQVSLFHPPLGMLAPFLLVAPAVYPVITTLPVYRVEDVKAVLAYMQARQRESDDVYVYYGAVPAVSFYDEQYGLHKGEYSVGGCHRGESRLYLQELDAFRGRTRLWVVFTHALWGYRERDDILAYLDAIGIQRDAFTVRSRTVGFQFPPAEVFLYDLSDPVRLQNTNAELFPLIGPSSGSEPFSCGRGPLAIVRPMLVGVH